MKDTRSILLVLLSVGIVATWVYHLYDKTQYSKLKKELTAKEPADMTRGIQDSLQKVYSLAVDRLGTQLDSAKNSAGLLQGELTARMDEINLLRTEIADLLRKSMVKKEDLDLAGKKTTRFQQLVARLPEKNNGIAEEKKQPPPLPGEIKIPEDRQEINPSTENITNNSIFTASDLHFTPVALKNEQEEETNEAQNADKLIISFAVKNTNTGYNNAEVFAVITQPDGKVLQTDVWDAATINTHDYGKKKYTRKLKFEYLKGETKHLQLTLKPEDYEKGNYRLQVFHNGYLIGEAVKTLN